MVGRSEFQFYPSVSFVLMLLGVQTCHEFITWKKQELCFNIGGNETLTYCGPYSFHFYFCWEFFSWNILRIIIQSLRLQLCATVKAPRDWREHASPYSPNKVGHTDCCRNSSTLCLLSAAMKLILFICMFVSVLTAWHRSLPPLFLWACAIQLLVCLHCVCDTHFMLHLSPHKLL